MYLEASSSQVRVLLCLRGCNSVMYLLSSYLMTERRAPEMLQQWIHTSRSVGPSRVKYWIRTPLAAAEGTELRLWRLWFHKCWPRKNKSLSHHFKVITCLQEVHVYENVPTAGRANFSKGRCDERAHRMKDDSLLSWASTRPRILNAEAKKSAGGRQNIRLHFR